MRFCSKCKQKEIEGEGEIKSIEEQRVHSYEMTSGESGFLYSGLVCKSGHWECSLASTAPYSDDAVQGSGGRN